MKIQRRLFALMLMIFTLLGTQVMVNASTTATEAVDGTNTNSNNKSNSNKAKSGIIKNDNFDIKISWGIDGNCRSGAALPISVTIESLQEDFQGVIRFITPESEYEYASYAYEQEVLLTKNTPKTVSMAIEDNVEKTAIKFELEDENGKTLISKDIATGGKITQDALVGILSDDYTALGYWDGVDCDNNDYSGKTSIVELNEDNFPDKYNAIAALSFLVIDNFDTSRLSKDQFKTIKKWVEAGGFLIIGTGSNYQQTLSAFVEDSEMLEGSVNGMTEGKLVVADSTNSTLAFGKNDGLADISIKGGSDIDTLTSSEKMVVAKDFSKGKIVVASFNWGMEPFRSWSLNKKFVGTLLGEISKGTTRLSEINYGGMYNDMSQSNVLSWVEKSKFPKWGILVFLLVAFMISAPIIYLILKKLDRRGWMWIVFPALAIIFTFLNLIATSNVRIKHPISSSLTVLYTDESGQKSKNIDMSIMVPSSNEETVNMSEALVSGKMKYTDSRSSSMVPYFVDLASSKNDEKYNYTSAMRETSDGYVYRIKNKSTFAYNYYSFKCRNNEFDEMIETKFKRTVEGFSGSVTNISDKDIKYLTVFTYGKMVPLGNIKAGQTIKFTEDDTMSCYEGDWYNFSMPGVEDYSEEYNRVQNLYDYLGTTYLSDLYGMTKDQMSVYTIGYVENTEADYIRNKEIEEANDSLIVKKERQGYEEYSDAKVLDLNAFAKGSGDWDPYDGQLYEVNAEEEFLLDGEISSVYAIRRAKDSQARYGTTSNTVVSFWNYETGRYDEIFSNKLLVEFKGKCPYLSDKNVMRVKFVCKNKDVDYAPILTIIGGDK